MKTKRSFPLFKRGLTKKKKLKPKKPENIYYSPAADMSPLMQYIGLALRTLVLYIGVFGITSFICGAAGLSHSTYWQAAIVTSGHIALFCIPVALAAAAASLGRIPAIITPVAYTGIYAAVISIAYGNPISFTAGSALRIYNFAIHKVANIYHSIDKLAIDDGYDYMNAQIDVNDPKRFVGTFLLATLIGIILYFCVQKKARITPIAILLTVIFAPILTYNIAEGTTGIAFILVFICAALALKVYDHRYGGKAERIAEKKRRKAEKKQLRLEKKEEKREERRALREEAFRVFDKAIDADMPLKQAKKAKKAVFKAHKNAKKAKKAANKQAKKLSKRSLKKAKKERTARLKALKKQLSCAKAKDQREAILAKIKEEDSIKAKNRDEKKLARITKRREKKEREKTLRKISMAGGYTGIGVALAAFIAVVLPMAIVSGPFMEIKPINDRVKATRAYVTAYLKGSDVDLNDPYAYGIHSLAPRQLSFEPLELDDKLLFRVDAEGFSNVYMRSWVATDFDWKTNEWKSGTYEDIYDYRETFERGYTPDSIKTNFYKYVYPSSSIITDENTYKNFSKYGFTVQQIDVWRVRGSSLLLFIPAHMNTDVGILDYGTTAPAPYKYQNYFEGTYSSFYYRYGRGYSTVSYITAYNRADSANSIEASLEYYDLCLELIRKNPSASKDEATALVYSFEKSLAENKIEFQGLSLVDRYYFSMTDAEKKAFLESADSEDAYRGFVTENYTQKSENEVIAEIAQKIKGDAVAKELEAGEDGVLSSHEAVMAVVEFLRSDEFYYTETPNQDLTNGKKPVIEAFLTDVKQGYCSHFASSAVFLLREMDVPCRYVEGYVASDFEPLGTSGAKNRADIYGTDAHAWIEVYVDNMGWMQYEVTPGSLSEDMYDPNSNTVDPNLDSITDEEEEDDYTPPPFGDEPDIDEIIQGQDDFEIEEEKSDLEYLLYLIISLLIVAAIATVITLIIRYISKRASMALEAKYEVIDGAKNIDVFYKKDTDNHKTARQINDWILEIFSLIGCEPKPGELPSEFISRMRSDYGDLSGKDIGEVVEAMQKEEFGHGVNYQELNTCAEYLEDITASVYASMNPFQKIINRYFKRKI